MWLLIKQLILHVLLALVSTSNLMVFTCANSNQHKKKKSCECLSVRINLLLWKLSFTCTKGLLSYFNNSIIIHPWHIILFIQDSTATCWCRLISIFQMFHPFISSLSVIWTCAFLKSSKGSLTCPRKDVVLFLVELGLYLL